jgi:hypothetical protein
MDYKDPTHPAIGLSAQETFMQTLAIPFSKNRSAVKQKPPFGL